MGIHTRLLTATLAIAMLGLPALAGPATAERGTDPSVGSISVSVAPAVLVGQPIRFRGVVKPRRAGLPVRLQRKVGSGWKNLSTTRTTAEGRYRLASTVEFGGTYEFRVIRLPWLTNSVRSRTVRVTAYVWNSVKSMVQPGDYEVGAVSFDEAADIDGTTYPNSTLIDADSQGTTEGGYFEIGLEGLNCAALDTVAGALDTNAANSEVGLKVSLDGTVIADKSYHLGESERLTLDVRGASRLRVEGSVVVEGPNGKLGLGTPRLLCAS